MDDSYLDQPIGRFLDALAAKQTAPGGGGVAAMATAMAAGLVAMAARFSEGKLDDAAEVAARADELRARAGPLADRDAQAYTQVVAAYRLPREPDSQRRKETIAAALHDAAEVPLDIARIAAEVAELAARLASEGNPNLAGDAATAVLLAEAAARSAAGLVRINVDSGNLDGGLAEEAARRVRTTADSVRQAGAAE